MLCCEVRRPRVEKIPTSDESRKKSPGREEMLNQNKWRSNWSTRGRGAGQRLKRRSQRKNEAIIVLYSIFRFGMVHYLCYFMLEIRMKNICPFLLHYHQVCEWFSKEFYHSLEWHLLVCRSSSSHEMTAADSIRHFVCIFFFPILPANACVVDSATPKAAQHAPPPFNHFFWQTTIHSSASLYGRR